MFKVVKKLKNLKKPLNELNWKNGNLYDNVIKFKHQLKEAQSKVEADPFNLNNKLEVVELLNKYNKAAENELKLLHQIAKVKWLKEGDRNSAYFLSILKARRHKNRVETIFGEDGVRYNGSNVADQFVNHFKNFLGKSIPVKPLSSLGDIVLLKLSEEDVTGIIEEVSGDEIKDALFGIDFTKAVGPDGKLLGEVNATLIALVPKIDTPDKVSDFRPIAYCNVLYKCISIILTNRIKNGLCKGGRGLRQGDPISPYLFTLVMEVFNMILVKEIKELGKFKYHYGCKEMQLTHMCFADDLLVLGLKRDLLTILPFKCGTLPMKYLGVPLVAKRHGVNDCKSLIKNVEKWISSWRNRLLPYAGRIGKGYHTKDKKKPNTGWKRQRQIKPNVKWLNAENKEVDFSTHVAWLSLREVWPRVDWWYVVWYSQCNPKQTLMAIQGKLLTKDRIMMWQNGDDLKCPLYKSVADSHIHLFFDCPFSLGVWKRIQTKSSSCRSGHNMNNIVTMLGNQIFRNNIHQFVDRLILFASVYYIWNERNKRMFQKCSRTEEDLARCIENNVGYMLKCLKVKKSSAILTVAKRWGLKWDKGYLLAEIKYSPSEKSLGAITYMMRPSVMSSFILWLLVECLGGHDSEEM
ncbi:RNA-directed DNA polymerase, eukaryota, reverse transcriptase zinc-binding domain protein [Tanacetum coccineum]